MNTENSPNFNPNGRLVMMKPKPHGTPVINFRGEAAQELARLTSEGFTPADALQLLKQIYGEPVPDDGSDD